MSYSLSILSAHSIRHRIIRGRLQAEDVYTQQRNGKRVTGRRWQDVTGWSRFKLLAWIGY
jgi:hypothetical protein